MPPVTIIPDTGVNNIYINANTGAALILTTGPNVLVPNHNALDGKQGGSGNQFYHLTEAQYSFLQTGAVFDPLDTGLFYLASNPSGYISTGNADSRFVNVTGNEVINGIKEFSSNTLFDQNIRVSGNITGNSVYVNQVSFDLNYSGPAIQEGELRWNGTDGTLDLGMNGGEIAMQLGQEMFTKVRNQSGSTITNGSIVYLSGRLGNRPLIALAKADNESTSRVAGVATEDIASPADGFITTVGYVRGIKTNYTGSGIWGTTWAEGDLLYVSKSVAGQLTNVEQAAPHHSDIVGTVGIVHATLGSILITMDRHRTLENLSDINGTALTADGQLPCWIQASGVFDFHKNINNYLPISGGSVSGDINFNNIGQGIILKSPNSTSWRITVDNSGQLITTSL